MWLSTKEIKICIYKQDYRFNAKIEHLYLCPLGLQKPRHSWPCTVSDTASYLSK